MRAIVPVLLLAATSLAALPARRSVAERALINDNRTPAGTRHGTALTLHLEARVAVWHPNGDDAPGASLPAFAEEGRAPRIPGPLIRVPAGYTVSVTVRNRLPNDTLDVHGLYDRTGAPVRPSAVDGLRLAPGEVRTVTFSLTAPGTYYYWGSTTGRAINWRTGVDAQLTGAIVVDPAGAPPPRDRILVLGMWADTVGRAYVPRRRVLAVINGRTWPHTERLVYDAGDTIRWRVINATADNHPMHLHGFYFQIDARGDGGGDTAYHEADAAHVVTESMPPGGTMRLSWVAERPGNWLFHCHIPEHFERRGPLGMPPEAVGHAAMHHADEDMSGLVMGVVVRPSAGHPIARDDDDRGRRRLRLLVRRNAGGSDRTPYFGFAIQDGLVEPPPDSGLHIGPPLVLARGQPVSIMVVNTLAEATSVHWHGIELESYYDGVAGFSGTAQRIAPLIAPGDSFDVHFTPPRAGTFIYHTHVDERRQEPAGLAGPIIVLDSGERFDTATDHAVMITSPWSWEDGRTTVLVNGSATPPALVLRAGARHRLRVVNMTTRRPALRVELRRDTTLLTWRELAKDGADLPASRRVARAAMHPISIGETFDVEIAPDAPDDLVLIVRVGGALPAHPILATLPIHVVQTAGSP